MTFGISLKGFVINSCMLVALLSVRNSAAQQSKLIDSRDTTVTAGDTLRITIDRSKLRSLARGGSVRWSNGDTSWTTTIVPERTIVLGYTITTVDSVMYYIVNVYVIDYKPIIKFNCSKLMVSEPLLACQWLMQGKPLAGATNATYQPTDAGSYNVTVVDRKGRIGTSVPIVVKDEADVSLLSDPDNNRLIINRIEVSNVVIWNEDGLEVMQVANTPKLSLVQLPDGRYDIAVWLGGCFARRFKVVKASK
jgi:hypothetical protein